MAAHPPESPQNLDPWQLVCDLVKRDREALARTLAGLVAEGFERVRACGDAVDEEAWCAYRIAVASLDGQVSRSALRDEEDLCRHSASREFDGLARATLFVGAHLINVALELDSRYETDLQASAKELLHLLASLSRFEKLSREETLAQITEVLGRAYRDTLPTPPMGDRGRQSLLAC